MHLGRLKIYILFAKLDFFGLTIFSFVFVFGVAVTEGGNVLIVHLNHISWLLTCIADTQKYVSYSFVVLTLKPGCSVFS